MRMDRSGGSAGGSGDGTDGNTNAALEAQLSRAETGFQRVLGTPGVDDTRRRQAELGLRQVAQARSTGAAPPELRTNPLFGLFINAVELINTPLAGVASGAKELTDLFRGDQDASFSEFVGGFSGTDTSENSFVQDLVTLTRTSLDPTLDRDLARQASFSDIVADFGGSSWYETTGRGIVGFGGDVLFDPLTYVGGVGLFDDALKAGAKGGSRSIATRGIDRRAIARRFLAEADKLDSFTPGARQSNVYREMASRVEGFGINGAKKSFDDEMLALMSEHVFTGVALRTPFRRTLNRFTNLDAPEVLAATSRGSGRTVTSIKAAGEAAGTRLRLVTPTNRAFRAAALRGGDDFAEHVTAYDVKRRSRVTASRWLTNTSARLAESIPGLSVNKSGNATLRSINSGAIARYNEPGVTEAIRTAIEAGERGSVTVAGETFDFDFVTDFLAEVHEDVTTNFGVPLGSVENFFPRVLRNDLSENADIAQRWPGLTQPERVATLQQREWAPGSVLGFYPDGSPAVLATGSLSEVSGILEALGRTGDEGFVNPFRSDLIGTLNQYVNGLASAVERRVLEVDLVNRGLLQSVDSLRGRTNIQLLEATADLRIFDGEAVQSVFAKILPSVATRRQALRFTNDALGETVNRLENKLAELTEQALDSRSLRDEYTGRLREARGGVRREATNRPAATVLLRQLDDIAALELKSARHAFELEELAEVKRLVQGESFTAEALGDIAEKEARVLEAKALVDRDLEVLLPAADSLMSKAPRSLKSTVDEYRATGRELVQSKAQQIPSGSISARSIRRWQQQLAQANKPFTSRRFRQQAIEELTVRQEVVSALTGSRMTSFVDDVLEASKGTLSAAERKTIRPALQTMRELVRFDNVTWASINRDPDRAVTYFRERSSEMLANGQPQGSRLMDAAEKIVNEARVILREAEELRESFAGDLPDEALKQRDELLNAARARMVYGQEAALSAELTDFGTDFGGERFLSFVENMSDSQWQAIVTTMSRDMDNLVPVGGGLFATDSVAEVVNWKAAFVENPGRILSTTRKLTRFFKPQATLSPGFSVRNLYSAVHMNSVLGGMAFGDYAAPRAALIAVRQAAIDGTDDALQALSPRHRQIAEAIFEGSDAGRNRLTDALNSPSAGVASRSSRIGEFYFTGLDSAGQALDRGVARVLTRNPLVKEEGADYAVEEFVRFSLAFHVMNRGSHGIDGALDLVARGHFDYGDLSRNDIILRDTAFPFWTFMSRNLPLQIELLAKNPGAYNNLVAWQEQTNARNSPGGLTPSYFNNSLNFSVPEEIPLLGGDQLTPDLTFNDFIQRLNEGGEVIGAGSGDFGFSNIGGVDPQAGLRMILSDGSPWTKVWYELLTQEDAFSQRQLGRFEQPVTNTALGDATGIGINPVTEVLGVLFHPLGWSARTPTDPLAPDGDREWLFTGNANQVLSSFIPLQRRIATLAPDEDSRFKRRQQAAWISFMAGGVREVGDTAYLNRAYELSDDAQELLDELSNYSIPNTQSVRGRATTRQQR